jgi:hypothetical protein
LNLYIVKTEDPEDKQEPYKAYMIIASDPSAAALLVPRRVVVLKTELQKRLKGGADLAPVRCGYFSAKFKFQ